MCNIFANTMNGMRVTQRTYHVVESEINFLNATIGIDLPEYFKSQEFKKKPALGVIQRLFEVDRGIKKLPLSGDWKKTPIQHRKELINLHVFKIGNSKGDQNQTGEVQEDGSTYQADNVTQENVDKVSRVVTVLSGAADTVKDRYTTYWQFLHFLKSYHGKYLKENKTEYFCAELVTAPIIADFLWSCPKQIGM
ncbi:unnamed protein product [Ambrosiozyma monospora]|uniref:Unnamed protein product n=1 Tax=Ambrosiozyma monospora TaxID=43982 RepID=A0A9W7DE30_AMBMO|nr:unnamed protein product [Ambrosiozyma monospora]